MGRLELRNVNKVYRVGTFGGDTLHAVKDVSFTAEPGQIISLLGESGSGKSTIGKMILRLAAITSGKILYDGKDVGALKGGELKPYQHKVQGVFQDPFSSYNPIFKADRVFGMVKDSFYGDVAQSEWDGRVEQALPLNACTILGCCIEERMIDLFNSRNLTRKGEMGFHSLAGC